ncbi:for [Symbiodinium natans]|uniref:For protein n=1 Tax=Symbiodinium natans TaxID=878477 RepID=A0A812P8W8_9DINO|nr:for [Symbiodinium natans]
MGQQCCGARAREEYPAYPFLADASPFEAYGDESGRALLPEPQAQALPHVEEPKPTSEDAVEEDAQSDKSKASQDKKAEVILSLAVLLGKGGPGRKKRKAPLRATAGDPRRPKMSDLKKVGLLGAGGFGIVELWEHKTACETYAVKCVSKGLIVETGTQDNVITEKNILFMTNSDFIIRLYQTYNSKQWIYFLMEPALGGDLHSVYHRKGFYGSEKHARYYSAGVVCALEHLHERNIVYRDLKPENLLLNEKGHLKVTDMGLAKVVIGKTYTTCGTAEYYAPEVIAMTGHSHAVDWWMLGVLIFELMTGSSPFGAPSQMEIYEKVLNGINAVEFPPQLLQCEDLCKAMCENEPWNRLPMLPGGAQNLKAHAWYKGSFDWDKFEEFTLDPPFAPEVRGKKELANFAVHPDQLPRFIEYVDNGSWDQDFATC